MVSKRVLRYLLKKKRDLQLQLQTTWSAHFYVFSSSRFLLIPCISLVYMLLAWHAKRLWQLLRTRMWDKENLVLDIFHAAVMCACTRPYVFKTVREQMNKQLKREKENLKPQQWGLRKEQKRGFNFTFISRAFMNGISCTIKRVIFRVLLRGNFHFLSQHMKELLHCWPLLCLIAFAVGKNIQSAFLSISYSCKNWP